MQNNMVFEYDNINLYFTFSVENSEINLNKFRLLKNSLIQLDCIERGYALRAMGAKNSALLSRYNYHQEDSTLDKAFEIIAAISLIISLLSLVALATAALFSSAGAIIPAAVFISFITIGSVSSFGSMLSYIFLLALKFMDEKKVNRYLNSPEVVGHNKTVKSDIEKYKQDTKKLPEESVEHIIEKAGPRLVGIFARLKSEDDYFRGCAILETQRSPAEVVRAGMNIQEGFPVGEGAPAKNPALG